MREAPVVHRPAAVCGDDHTIDHGVRTGVVHQVVSNTLSEDNNTSSYEYIRIDKDGKITGMRRATCIRRPRKPFARRKS